MFTINLGHTNVPAVGIGTWNIGDDPAKHDDEVKAIQTAIDAGATVIDTAEMYGYGRAERITSEALSPYSREKLFLIDKVLPENAGRANLEKSLDRSLELMKTDYFDLYLLHWRGSVPLAETVEELTKMQQKGKIRHWGVSNFDTADIKELWSLPNGQDCLANEDLYNLDERGIEYDLLPLMKQQGMPLIAYSPLSQGDTISGNLTNHPLLKELAGNHHATVYQIMLAWTIRDHNTLAIPKAASPLHAKENLEALNITFTTDELKALEKAFPKPQAKQPLATI
ncbi:MAG: aldo/keto reductase [Limosilactobacillus sp.]|jgi:diketogulonate reductase-like aldo/keto reductase|uniref:aldo/keto reductase n=1 Tax=Limosilactobacillus sp. TaxID=2773925 RepID=UPI0025BFCA5D|nr:aldo/keto reductase [Limosilactobacillus sp.]MCI1975228.1 aldo/keto reductase [Limosilactobacillus sp.]MCI2031302.1 aldo/keto reductase [Limosilactobacillus sp.]